MSKRYMSTLLALLLGMSFSASATDVTMIEAESAQTTRSYWTEDNKANAIPMPLPEVVGTPQAAKSATPPGEARRVDGVFPGGAKATTYLQEQVAPSFGSGSTVWYDYPPPFSSYGMGPGYLRYPPYPHSTLGKLFFTDGASNFVCSATSVTSAGDWGEGNRQTVFTAGHCCSNGAGNFYNNWVFEPAHRDGLAPYGSWTAGLATVFTVWHENADLSRDLCVLQMYTNDSGESLHDVVGALGYAFNWILPQHYHATGWPAEAPFTGGRLIIAIASDAETDTDQAGDFPYTHGIGSNLTGGSSGGAWILLYKLGSLFNGVNSYKYISPDRPNEMFGPYIDDVVINTLLGSVATGPSLP